MVRLLSVLFGFCLSPLCYVLLAYWQVLALFVTSVIAFFVSQISSSTIASSIAGRRDLSLQCLALVLMSFSYAQLIGYSQLSSRLPVNAQEMTCEIYGEVVSIPMTYTAQTTFLFRKLESLTSTCDILMNKTQILSVKLPNKRLDILSGDRFKFHLKIRPIKGLANLHTQDHELYALTQKIDAQGYVKNPSAVQDASRMTFDRYRMLFYRDLQQSIESVQVAEVIAALVMGIKQGIPIEIKQILMQTGVGHIFAISGLHVMLVAGLAGLLTRVVFVFRPCQAETRHIYIVYAVAMCVAIFYTACAGFSIATKRAMIMVIIWCLCRMSGKSVSGYFVLLLAAVVILVYEPLAVTQIGFWLSFVAVAVIIFASHYWGNRDSALVSAVKIQYVLCLTLAPLLYMGISGTGISFISILANLIVVPLFALVIIPLSFLVSFCILVIGSSSTLVSLLDALLTLIFDGLVVLAHWNSAINTYINSTTHLDSTLLCIVWFCLLLLFFPFTRLIRLWLGVLLAALVLRDSALVEQGHAVVTVSDVGQGLSVNIQTHSHTLVYDLGDKVSNRFSMTQAVVEKQLPHSQAIDMLIISHADKDHMGDYVGFLARQNVTQVVSGMPDAFAGSKNCHLMPEWEWDGVTFKFIPLIEGISTKKNDKSCVLLISAHNKRVLITGDIEAAAESYLVENDAAHLKADVLVVGHHGSKTSSSDGFLNAVQPTFAVVSAGYRNKYGHPHYSVVERLQNKRVHLLNTANDGAISFSLNDTHVLMPHTVRETRRGFWVIRPH